MTAQGGSRSDFAAFSARFHRHFCRDANACLALGVEERSGELPDPSLAERRARVAEAVELESDAERLRAGATADARLDPDQELDLQLATLMLRAEVHADTLRYNGRLDAEQLPSVGHDVGTGLFLLLVSDPRPLPDRLADVTRRLESVPAYLAELEARLDRPIERWVRMDLDKVAGLDALFESTRSIARQGAYSDVSRLELAIGTATTALAGYRQRLAATPVETRFAVGEQDAQAVVVNRGIELGLDQLHQLARTFLAETAELLEELRGRLVAKHRLAPDTTAEQLDRTLKRRFAAETRGPELDAILERYRDEHERIVRFVRASGLFPLLDDESLTILRTPPFMQPSIPAGAMFSPPPFRAGTKRSLIYLTLSEELRDEHTELGIPHMMIHEGVPGHHLQLSHAAAHPSTIRRHVSAMDQAEGWTTMLEDYVLDLGYMGTLVDETRFVAKRELCRIGARVAIDLFFMTGDAKYLDVGIDIDGANADPFRAAGSLLAAVTGFVDERVEAELNWYSQERGYPLSYLTGNHLVWTLRRDVERTWGQGRARAEVDRIFHEVFLQAGSMPMAFLRRVFERRGLLRAPAR